jgi:hypothetical protein
MFPASGGEDHLGLASVSSDQILPRLSPTINVATVHPRYHSFYAFLLDEFWRRDLPRSSRAWVRFFRPRDFIYSVAMHLCDHPDHEITHGVTGSRNTRGLVDHDPEAYDTTCDYIKERLGGYGLYYRSVLAGMGLVYQGGRGGPYPVDVPTEHGKEVAESFRSTIVDTDYYRIWFVLDEAYVPKEVVREYARIACLCRLRKESAPDGPLLRDVFLHHPPAYAEARRLTLRMLLDIAVQTDGHAVDEDAFRRLLFFGATGDGATFAPRTDLDHTAAKWRLYQAREYYVFALTGIWCHLCDWGLEENGDLRPVSLDAVTAHVEESLDFDELAGRLSVAPPRLGATSPFVGLLDWLASLVGCDRVSYDDRCDIQSPLNEHILYGLGAQESDGAARIAAAIATLASLFLRFGRPERWMDLAWKEVSRCGEEGRLSVDRFMRDLHRLLRGGSPTIGEVASWIVGDYVIQQHQLVATAKLPENTFRFEREGNRLRFHPHDNSLRFSDSRFSALSQTLYELGFCGDLHTSGHGLSQLGRRLLEDGDLVG